MSNSNEELEPIFSPDQPVQIKRNPPLPQPGYGLVFRDDMAQQISEFVSSPFYKKLKRIYGLQAKDRAARSALNSAQNLEWLHYYKGIAASTDLFFQDMEATHKEYKKANSDDNPEDRKHKK